VLRRAHRRPPGVKQRQSAPSAEPAAEAPRACLNRLRAMECSTQEAQDEPAAGLRLSRSAMQWPDRSRQIATHSPVWQPSVRARAPRAAPWLRASPLVHSSAGRPAHRLRPAGLLPAVPHRGLPRNPARRTPRKQAPARGRAAGACLSPRSVPYRAGAFAAPLSRPRRQKLPSCTFLVATFFQARPWLSRPSC